MPGENISTYYKDPIDESIVYKRTGYCCKCGECCLPVIPCPHLSMSMENGVQVGNCLIRNDMSYGAYIIGCISWPSEPDHIKGLEKCTYKFEVVNGS